MFTVSCLNVYLYMHLQVHMYSTCSSVHVWFVGSYKVTSRRVCAHTGYCSPKFYIYILLTGMYEPKLAAKPRQACMPPHTMYMT